MVSGLFSQTKALSVTLLAEFATEHSHEMGHSESQEAWLLGLCHKQQLAISYHHPCDSGTTRHGLVLQMLCSMGQCITHPPEQPQRQMLTAGMDRGQNTSRCSVLELWNRQNSDFEVISTKVFKYHPCQIKISVMLFTLMLPFSWVGTILFHCMSPLASTIILVGIWPWYNFSIFCKTTH